MIFSPSAKFLLGLKPVASAINSLHKRVPEGEEDRAGPQTASSAAARIALYFRISRASVFSASEVLVASTPDMIFAYA